MQAITPPVITIPDAILTEFYAEYKGNIGRLDRAIQLVEAGHVERSNFPGLWLVRSASVENGSYRVTNGCCNCPDTARVGAQNCKHSLACRLFQQAERAEVDMDQEDQPRCPLHGDDECDWGCPGSGLDPRTVEVDAEQSDPTPAPDDDTYYCVLCEEPIPAAEVVETRWGFMHERCAMTEPPVDPDAACDLELTGRAMLALVPTAALPAPIGTIRRVPVVLSARAAQAAQELYGDDYSGDAA